MKTNQNLSPIYIPRLDYDRLLQLVQQEREVQGIERLAALSQELKRAQLLAADAVQPDIVTMNSRVRLREISTGTELEITLVYPPFADISTRKISILAPVATAVLGCRVGDQITWPVPRGKATYQVEAVLYQPASNEVS